ncbi:5-deoxy-glucuronate isomerase [Herbaspirillum seropedicae]|uniref:Myo-inositol catabolism protein n=1 Tax=Herbaspirillum seropedicae (strain SmR1) TaxID=757424 RepID=D8IVJ0_HERSS|nr:5-deoxy-glucuronate isomerase [Herbaspirillum seropedicae]ADJ63929.1 myo-inositol catabolism protein [Herbaspirillum seropedicae SmR1]AKN65907.1 5-deoxyglucuronate isomerase [Herbaspirillum seropedicae]NQE29058.1 5-deoxyglucuronate isomerase [Herbaspirillum seropedicae]UMU21887.1 5-deoxy-glucuronate isomerase [Herbaspirillum seropedicae]
MSLLVKAQRSGRDIVQVTPQSAGWRYVGFSAHRLARGEQLALDTGDREYCVVILAGVVSVQAGSSQWREIGQRRSVFDDVPAASVYVPHHHRLTLTADSDAEVALCSAPGFGELPPRLIGPEAVTQSVRGEGSNTRYVSDILPQTAAADHLLVVEVRTPGGHSSSYPPHKHDTDNLPQESFLEETYYHRLNPAQGFAFQRVYVDDRSLDESMAVENHDVVMVPRGYHPVVVPHGYESYYLNVMAGPTRSWHFRNDPAHEWMLKR